jgi:hypothetical protein
MRTMSGQWEMPGNHNVEMRAAFKGAFDPDQARDDHGRWSSGGGGGGVAALPLPPKQAPEHVKEAYRERQRNYTRMRSATASREDRAKAKVAFEKATKTIDDWKAKGSTRVTPKEPAQKPGRQTTSTTGAKTYANPDANYKAQIKALSRDGITQRVEFYDRERRPAEAYATEHDEKQYTRAINLVGSEGTRMQRDIGGISNLPPMRRISFYAGQAVPDRDFGGKSNTGYNGLYTFGARDMKLASLPMQTTDRPTLSGKAWSTDRSAAGLFRHEFGHHAWGASKKAMKDDWAKVDNSNERHGWAAAEAISRYAVSGGVHEHFAEAFCAWTHAGYKSGSMPPQTEAFMQKYFPRKGR